MGESRWVRKAGYSGPFVKYGGNVGRRPNQLMAFTREQADVLISIGHIYHKMKSVTAEFCAFWDLQQNKLKMLRRGSTSTPNEDGLLWPLYRTLVVLDPEIGQELPEPDRAMLVAGIHDIKSWPMTTPPPRNNKGAVDNNTSRLIGRSSSSPQKTDTHLFEYFRKSANITRDECVRLRTQLAGVHVAYRYHSPGQVLKSVFIIPDEQMSRGLRAWIDAVVPSFWHWLIDEGGNSRHVRGHVIPLGSEATFIGFVEDSGRPGSFTGVKILALERPNVSRFTDAEGAFFSKYITNDYESGRFVMVRVESFDPASRRRMRALLRQWNSRADTSADAFVTSHLGDYVRCMSVEEAEREMRERRRDLNSLSIGVIVDGVEKRFLGPAILRR